MQKLSKLLVFQLAMSVMPLLVATLPGKALAIPKPGFTYYERGHWRTESWSKIRKENQWDIRGGHQPWRKQIATVAAITAGNLLPPVANNEKERLTDIRGRLAPGLVVATRTWRARYTVVARSSHRARVLLSVSGNGRYVISLRRPYHYAWYVTGIRRANRRVCGCGRSG